MGNTSRLRPMTPLGRGCKGGNQRTIRKWNGIFRVMNLSYLMTRY
jgi:hypothetical protein